MNSSKDGVPCYVCNLQFCPDYLLTHLRKDHTHDEVAFHLSVVYLDDWREERQMMAEAQIVE